MVERRRGLCFLLETPQPVFVARDGSWQQFDSDFAIKSLVTRAIEFSHSARADFRDDALARESCVER